MKGRIKTSARGPSPGQQELTPVSSSHPERNSEGGISNRSLRVTERGFSKGTTAGLSEAYPPKVAYERHRSGPGRRNQFFPQEEGVERVLELIPHHPTVEVSPDEAGLVFFRSDFIKSEAFTSPVPKRLGKPLLCSPSPTSVYPLFPQPAPPTY